MLKVGIVVEWLKCRDCDWHDLGSKPTRVIWGHPWERHFTELSPAWWSWQTVVNFNHTRILIKINPTETAWHLRKQVGVILATC